MAGVAVLALTAASCGGGDSDNVMAPQVNALDPEQVDRALGPEIGSADANGAESAAESVNEVDAADPVETTSPPSQAPAVSNRAAASPDPSDAPEAALDDENGVEEGQ
ncbi:MAG: hypothetical protein ACR2JJ_00290 [Sphingomicrobium sp.]